MLPKMFATDASEKDPIVVYKLYTQKRPEKMNEDHSPFYLAVNNTLKAESVQTKEWFKVGPVGWGYIAWVGGWVVGGCFVVVGCVCLKMKIYI